MNENVKKLLKESQDLVDKSRVKEYEAFIEMFKSLNVIKSFTIDYREISNDEGGDYPLFFLEKINNDIDLGSLIIGHSSSNLQHQDFINEPKFKQALFNQKIKETDFRDELIELEAFLLKIPDETLDTLAANKNIDIKSIEERIFAINLFNQ